ncbi:MULTISPECIES: Mu transposase C-terminal domain-containing protein [Actinomadura]|uniref:Mu transposase C-terminal domain-containing protein n=1 Tax=Actinomadura sp. NPDC000929 TaxID=3154517 RepID=UPI00339188F6
MARRVNPERRAAAVARLLDLREAGALTSGHVRLAAAGLGISERTVWRWLGSPGGDRGRRPGREPYQLTDIDREAFAYFHGSVAAVHRARDAVAAAHAAARAAGRNTPESGASAGTASAGGEPAARAPVPVDEVPVGEVLAAGVPVPQFLVAGWADAARMSLRSLERAFARELTPAERAAFTVGEEGVRRVGVYAQRPPSPRNAVWEMDHKQLPIVVLPQRGHTACRPWVTTIVDDGTRALVGWAISLTPHTGTVLTAIRMAMVHDPARGPFGAVPAGVRIDRGLEFAAAAVRDALAALCVEVDRLPPRMAFRKGKVERIHRTIEQTMLHALPGFTKGPRNAAGRLYGPLDDRLAARVAAAELTEGGPMALERFAALFASWAHWYNTARPHSMLPGRATPAQAWDDDPGPLNRIDAALLRHLLMAGADAVIGKWGIRRNNLYYIAPELAGRGGTRVQIRYMPRDDRFIEVYLDGGHLCTAVPQAQATPEQRAQIRAHAAEERKQLARRRRRAGAAARATLVPLTDQQTTVQDAQALPAAPGDQLAARRGGRAADDMLRRRARSNLLDPTADPTASSAGEPAADAGSADGESDGQVPDATEGA